tara:strand:+ start:7274 stop:8023 length:750 start_codon:yes stop_codon:yes gene_type:complete
MKIRLNNVLFNIKHPIISYGIIAFTFINNEVKYILINKKNTVGFCDIVKGNYDKKNIHIAFKNITEILTQNEVKIILNNSFHDIWKYMWKKNVDSNSEQIFNTNKELLFKTLKSRDTYWDETEWEFPKGRKEYQEKDLDCALREFQEETGINSKYLKILFNINPLEEIYIGTNLNYYKHKYYIGYIDASNINLTNFQKEEVNNVSLYTYSESLKKIRNYHKSKRECLKITNNIIKTLNFFSPNINDVKS